MESENKMKYVKFSNYRIERIYTSTVVHCIINLRKEWRKYGTLWEIRWKN